jgi:hypothetical protein
MEKEEPASAIAELLNTGTIEFWVGNRTVHIRKLGTSQPNTLLFTVFVDGITLDGHLAYDAADNRVLFPVPVMLRGEIGRSVIVASSLHEIVRGVINTSIFPTYLRLIPIHAKMRERTLEEAIRFRDVLVTKYHQLTFTNEYDKLETDRFIDEVKRFAENSLFGVDIEIVMAIVPSLVAGWAEEAKRETPAADPTAG